MLDTLEVQISDHPIPDLKNFKQASHSYIPRNRHCCLRISVYPGTDEIAFYGLVQHSLEELSKTLAKQSD